MNMNNSEIKMGENLTKREWFTGMVLGALLSNFKVVEGDSNRENRIRITVECAVALADATMARLNEKK